MYALTVKFACATGAEGWDPGGGCNAAERQRQPQNLDSQSVSADIGLCSFRNGQGCPGRRCRGALACGVAHGAAYATAAQRELLD